MQNVGFLMMRLIYFQSLECQLRLRNSELEASQQQMKLAEERQQGEIDNIKHAVQVRLLDQLP